MSTPKHSSPIVFCSEHPEQIIIMIDADAQVSKSLYCCLCMMEKSSHNAIPKTLITIQDFVKNASKFYEEAKSRAVCDEDAPVEHTEQLTKKAEHLEQLTKNLSTEKARIREIFNDIRIYVKHYFDKREKECEDLLEHEIEEINTCYTQFEKIIKAGWPKSADLEVFYPGQEELERRLSKISRLATLQKFVADIKADQRFDSGFNQDKQLRTKNLDKLREMITSFDHRLPVIDLADLSIDKMEKHLREGLDAAFKEKARIQNPAHLKLFPESKIIQEEDFKLLKSWLPKQYKCDLELLYRSSVDGKTAQSFHNKCDKKGPTIALIQCKFHGASHSSIIGGFTDQSWDINKNQHVTSSQSFIFSLTSKVKCPIKSNAEHLAVHVGGPHGPVFGSGNDIYISDNVPKNCYVYPNSYQNANAIVDIQSYQGSGIIYFTTENVEVYSVQ